MVCAFALGTGVYFGSKLWAAPAPAVPAPTRIALLNLRMVIKKYTGYQQFIDSMKAEEKKYIEMLNAKQRQLEAIAKQVELLQGQAREAKEEEARVIQREMEAIKLDARKKVADKSNEEMVKTYKEVREVAARYARANKIDLVLHFEGPADDAEVDSAVLITRNMNAGGCVPFHWDPSLDISEKVLEALNAAQKKQGK
jgi:Skp family chaperone for outer membrane proteins